MISPIFQKVMILLFIQHWIKDSALMTNGKLACFKCFLYVEFLIIMDYFPIFRISSFLFFSPSSFEVKQIFTLKFNQPCPGLLPKGWNIHIWFWHFLYCQVSQATFPVRDIWATTPILSYDTHWLSVSGLKKLSVVIIPWPISHIYLNPLVPNRPFLPFLTR